jgi:hypothetical protein
MRRRFSRNIKNSVRATKRPSVLSSASSSSERMRRRIPSRNVSPPKSDKAGALARGGEERLFVEAHERNPQTAQTPADRVHRAYGHG